MAMTHRYTYWVSTPPTEALVAARRVLEADGFRCTEQGPYAVLAELGSKTKAALLGAFALYMKLDLLVTAAEEGDGAHVVLAKSSSGAMGGVIGVSKTSKKFAALDQAIVATFGAALLGRQEA